MKNLIILIMFLIIFITLSFIIFDNRDAWQISYGYISGFIACFLVRNFLI